MKQKLIALGLFSPLLLGVICVVGFSLVCAGAWLVSSSEEPGGIIRIMPVRALPTVEAVAPSAIANTQSPPEAPVQVNLPPPAFESKPQAETASTNFTLTSAELEEALGFSLPPGTVNSITHQGVATQLFIPRLNLNSNVTLAPIEDQTWKVADLAQKVGHLEGTAPPGSDSNIVLAAHVTLSSGEYGPFAGLGQLTAGDDLYVYSGQEIFRYQVDGNQKVDRTAIDITYPTETGQITLITCNNWSAEEGRYMERLVVKGHLVEE